MFHGRFMSLLSPEQTVRLTKMTDGKWPPETVRVPRVNNRVVREGEGRIRPESTAEGHGGLHLKAHSGRWRVAGRRDRSLHP